MQYYKVFHNNLGVIFLLKCCTRVLIKMMLTKYSCQKWPSFMENIMLQCIILFICDSTIHVKSWHSLFSLWNILLHIDREQYIGVQTFCICSDYDALSHSNKRPTHSRSWMLLQVWSHVVHIVHHHFSSTPSYLEKEAQAVGQVSDSRHDHPGRQPS